MVEIEWSSTAENDLNEIVDYIGQDSPQYASFFYEQILDKIEKLLNLPILLSFEIFISFTLGKRYLQ
ncbi:hypothetical protein LCGC14_2904930 [marine sediment metagenome]|uniref:Plasmid stabilization system protein n=1 Tax=marine sediment metagenome TaxID=412755 RepID=A0A0F9A135_9ZZZZ